VKKKQRESALEIQIAELNTKVERLEKDLDASRSENSFLRDLIIKKIGLGAPSPQQQQQYTSPSTSSLSPKEQVPGTYATGTKKSGGQDSVTGMGTRL